jgi:ABC-type nitrate/sulfonate/bicarbonate transport system ATPase subunit
VTTTISEGGSGTEMESLLQLRSVSKTFGTGANQLEVLRDVTIDVSEGEFVSIVGPSGCGKSTLFNLITGQESLSSGEIRFNGKPAQDGDHNFAFMPQKDLLLPWRNVIDNTTVGLEIQGMSKVDSRAKAKPLFDLFGLAGFEENYPWMLSGGMRQRASLLRTVVQDKKVLLLDEPFGALDSLTRTEMQEWIADVWEKFRWTVLLITHDIREAIYLSDRVYVFTARPGSISMTFDIDLPRPRDFASTLTSEFLEIETTLLKALHGV